MATLMRVVDRVVVLDHGEKIAEGRAARGGRGPARRRGVPRREDRADVSAPACRSGADARARRRHRRLRPVHRAVGRGPARRGGRGGGGGRPERRGQDDADARDLGPGPAARGHARLRGRVARRPARPRDRRPRHRPRAGGPAHLPRALRGRQPQDGRVPARGAAHVPREPGARLRALPRPRRAARRSARAACRAASSRCSRSGARSCRARS